MTMPLSKLFAHASRDPLIRELTLDSRAVRPGDLFLAVPGAKVDGRDHIADALARGAAAVAYEEQGATVLPLTDVALIPVKGLIAQLSEIAGRFYGEPSRQLNLIGVTGTNGKTSVTQLLAQALDKLGQHCGLIGTLGTGFFGELQSGRLTTPDPIAVQATLYDLKKSGAKAVAMEVSSHALEQGRVAALAFDIAVMTNLSRDHLDYHGSMQAYEAAKAKLFAWPNLHSQVVNLDDEFGRRLAADFARQPMADHVETRLLSYSLENPEASLYCREATFDDDGVRAILVTAQGERTLRSQLLGRFNLSNMLAAVATLMALDYPLDEILKVTAKLEGPVGRMQRLGGGHTPLVVVDYAHTPDALEKVLEALRPHAHGKLLCLFGCGGDRDSGKRPLMAEVAERLADRVLVTDDNPRSEDPARIFDDIRPGFAQPDAVEFVAGRGAAIAHLIATAAADDVIVLAGKGHEDYQEINGERHDFSDLVEAQKALTAWGLHMLKPFKLSEVSAALNARLLGADVSFGGVSIDSRSVTDGQLFVALKGPNFDGHDYLADVKAKGAVAALVEREVADVGLPQLVVADCRLALGQLGALNRALFDKPVAAITGSSGKTTVKEMLACILRTRGPVLATRGNLNNDLGAPLTLLEIAGEHSAAVIELGASRIGEIRYTVGLTRPQVVIINNAGTAHVGEFGGPEKIVEAKGEILEGLGEGGTAILNLDDKAFAIWQKRAGNQRILSFALSNSQADFHASDIGRDARGCPSFTLHGPDGSVPVQLNLLGTHNVSNALAAAAAAHALGVSLPGIAAGLNAVQPVKGRTVVHMAPGGARVIDDSYNANPTSMCAAIDILAGFSGRTVLVLGDIGELGQWAQEGHRQVGDYARGKVNALYAVGTNMTHAVAAFGADGRHFATQAELIDAVSAENSSNTTILIKGSRSAAMEHVVAALCGASGEKH